LVVAGYLGSLAIVRLVTFLAMPLSLQLFGCVGAPTVDASTDPVAKVIAKVSFTEGGFVNFHHIDGALTPQGRALLTELWTPSRHFRYTIEFASGRLISVESRNDASIGECVWVKLPSASSQLVAFALGQANLRSGASCSQLSKIDG
jgi:hypothetical protein